MPTVKTSARAQRTKFQRREEPTNSNFAANFLPASPARDLSLWFQQEIWSEGEAACLLAGLNPDNLGDPVPPFVLEVGEQLRRAFVVGELPGWTDETKSDSARLFNQGSDGELLSFIGRARFYRTEDLTAWATAERFPAFRNPGGRDGATGQPKAGDSEREDPSGDEPHGEGGAAKRAKSAGNRT
jgi:hypothetical protein